MRSWWQQPGFSHPHAFISLPLSQALQTHPGLPTLEHHWLFETVEKNSKIYRIYISIHWKLNEFIFCLEIQKSVIFHIGNFPQCFALHNEQTFPQPLVAGLGAAHFLFWKLPSCSHTGSQKTVFVKLRDCNPHKITQLHQCKALLNQSSVFFKNMIYYTIIVFIKNLY